MAENEPKTQAPDEAAPKSEADAFDDDPIMREFARDPALTRDAQRLAQSRRELLGAPFEDDEDSPKKKGQARKPRQRPLWVAVLMAGVCAYFLFFVWGDVRYFLSGDDPIALGEAADFTSTPLEDDSYVTITGVRNPSRGVNLPGSLLNRNIFQLIGTKKVLVDTNAETEEKGVMLESRSFAGRLKRFANMPYYRAVRDFAMDRYGVEFPADAIVVRAGDRPSDYWHMALSAVALGGIMLFNLLQIGLALKRRLSR